MLLRHGFNNQKCPLKMFPRCSQVYVPKMFPRIPLKDMEEERSKKLRFCHHLYIYSHYQLITFGLTFIQFVNFVPNVSHECLMWNLVLYQISVQPFRKKRHNVPKMLPRWFPKSETKLDRCFTSTKCEKVLNEKNSLQKWQDFNN